MKLITELSDPRLQELSEVWGPAVRSDDKMERDSAIAVAWLMESTRAALARAEKAEVCTNCHGGCPDKDHPAIHHLCAECHQENVKAFNRVSEEKERLREAIAVYQNSVHGYAKGQMSHAFMERCERDLFAALRARDAGREG